MCHCQPDVSTTTLGHPGTHTILYLIASIVLLHMKTILHVFGSWITSLTLDSACFVMFKQIVIVSNEDEHTDFIQEIGEEALPEEYGGQAKLTALQDVILPQLEGWLWKWIKASSCCKTRLVVKQLQQSNSPNVRKNSSPYVIIWNWKWLLNHFMELLLLSTSYYIIKENF